MLAPGATRIFDPPQGPAVGSRLEDGVLAEFCGVSDLGFTFSVLGRSKNMFSQIVGFHGDLPW